MRGYLLMPHLVGYRQLDISGSSYDRVWREPTTTDDGSQLGSDGRVETLEVSVKAQFNERFFEQLNVIASGDTPKSVMIITHHDRDLEVAGLIGSDKRPTIKKGDRIATIRNHKTNDLLMEIRNPPGLWVQEVRPSGWGMGGRINLWDVVVGDREKGYEG